jgi:hypothetical protein
LQIVEQGGKLGIMAAAPAQILNDKFAERGPAVWQGSVLVPVLLLVVPHFCGNDR